MLILGDDTSAFMDTIAQGGKSYNYVSDFMNMIVVLIAVIALALGTVYILKRLMKTRLQLSRTTSMRILERRSLGPKSALYLVDLLGKGVVISESAAGIHVIKEFSDEINIEELMDEVLDEPEPRIPLKEKIAAKLKLKVAKRA